MATITKYLSVVGGEPDPASPSQIPDRASLRSAWAEDVVKRSLSRSSPVLERGVGVFLNPKPQTPNPKHSTLNPKPKPWAQVAILGPDAEEVQDAAILEKQVLRGV